MGNSMNIIWKLKNLFTANTAAASLKKLDAKKKYTTISNPSAARLLHQFPEVFPFFLHVFYFHNSSFSILIS